MGMSVDVGADRLAITQIIMAKKIIDITPQKYSCALVECPAVFKTEDHTYIIIGKIHDADHPTLQGRVGQDEIAIEISAELLEGALASKISRR